MAQVPLINAQDLALLARSPLQATPPVPSALLELSGLQPDSLLAHVLALFHAPSASTRSQLLLQILLLIKTYALTVLLEPLQLLEVHLELLV